MTMPPFGSAPIDEPSQPVTGEEVSGPEELRIKQAMDFYRAALQEGPRLAREVLAEGTRQGFSKRTQERARSRLNVQKIPPTTWQGPWLIALPGDPAVAESKQRREAKKRQAQQRQGNGQSRRRQQRGEGSPPHDALLTAAR